MFSSKNFLNDCVVKHAKCHTQRVNHLFLEMGRGALAMTNPPTSSPKCESKPVSTTLWKSVTFFRMPQKLRKGDFREIKSKTFAGRA